MYNINLYVKSLVHMKCRLKWKKGQIFLFVSFFKKNPYLFLIGKVQFPVLGQEVEGGRRRTRTQRTGRSDLTAIRCVTMKGHSVTLTHTALM